MALLLAATPTILSNAIISPARPGIQESFEGEPNADLLVPLMVSRLLLGVAVALTMTAQTALASVLRLRSDS